jgi:hypothetical protein
MMCYATAGLLFLLPFLRKDKRGLQDMVSATSVIDDKQLYQYFITPMRSESEVLEINVLLWNQPKKLPKNKSLTFYIQLLNKLTIS